MTTLSTLSSHVYSAILIYANEEVRRSLRDRGGGYNLHAKTFLICRVEDSYSTLKYESPAGKGTQVMEG